MIFSEIFSLIGNIFIGSWTLWWASHALVDVYGRHLMQLAKTEKERVDLFLRANNIAFYLWFFISVMWAGNLVIRIWFRT